MQRRTSIASTIMQLQDDAKYVSIRTLDHRQNDSRITEPAPSTEPLEKVERSDFLHI